MTNVYIPPGRGWVVLWTRYILTLWDRLPTLSRLFQIPYVTADRFTRATRTAVTRNDANASRTHRDEEGPTTVARTARVLESRTGSYNVDCLGATKVHY